MDYYEIVFTYKSLIEADIINDLLAAELGHIGFESFESDKKGLKAYISTNEYNPSLLEGCLKQFPLCGIVFNHTKMLIKERNWNEEWEKNYFKPFCIGHKCIVRASFHDEEKRFEHTVIIDPKMAFGTGNHATTYLMLCYMLETDIARQKILDMGCGTAVLAILAAKKKASRVVAIDIDKWAYNNAKENCMLNHTEKIEVFHGGAELIKGLGTFDSIFANINRNILLQDIKHYAPSLRAGGLLFMSGFYKDDIPVIEDMCNRNSLTLSSFTERNKWVAVKVKK